MPGQLCAGSKSECAALLWNVPQENEPPSTSKSKARTSCIFRKEKKKKIDLFLFICGHIKLYVTCELLDRDAEEARASGSAIVKVQRYRSASPHGRSQDPVVYWRTHKALNPDPYPLENQYLATPASSVPYERVVFFVFFLIKMHMHPSSPKHLTPTIPAHF